MKMKIKPRMMYLFCICVSFCEDIHNFSHMGMQKRATSYGNVDLQWWILTGQG